MSAVRPATSSPASAAPSLKTCRRSHPSARCWTSTSASNISSASSRSSKAAPRSSMPSPRQTSQVSQTIPASNAPQFVATPIWRYPLLQSFRSPLFLREEPTMPAMLPAKLVPPLLAGTADARSESAKQAIGLRRRRRSAAEGPGVRFLHPSRIFRHRRAICGLTGKAFLRAVPEMPLLVNVFQRPIGQQFTDHLIEQREQLWRMRILGIEAQPIVAGEQVQVRPIRVRHHLETSLAIRSEE